ncbi:unnamed protein product [Bursaphelenchus okinawaensis]|uniref:glucuronosyltransferase n=1 Tax=Bursaphelenchus okinawaensis TaxID=465554 RepID=A0A811K0E5_9BILA|nr:unnamed protein product [Bursaphelenchus okinawaensis]CAG9089074.1 unnamed protein product [Bursaphelenchus okinawaensis]
MFVDFKFSKKSESKKHILVYSSAVPQTDAAMFGVPATPSITPNIAYGYTPDMTFYERVQNFLSYWVNHFVMLEVLKGEPAKAYKNVFGVDFDYQQAFAESQYVFVNTDEHLDFPQIITQKRVHIGGLGMQNNDLTVELPQEMAQKIKEFKQGFVLVSFGTVASSYSMPEHVKTAFKEAFQMFPEVLFVMKYEKDDEYAKGVKNIYKVKWLPQRSLLNHPKVLAFITHSGMNSVTEATNAGVPMVNVPLFADQMYNSAMAISKGVGYRLDKFKITKNTVVEALRTVIQDESYKKRSKELSRMIRAKPMSPDERIQKYSEFAAEFNIADNLDIYGRDFSTGLFTEYSLSYKLSFAVCTAQTI